MINKRKIIGNEVLLLHRRRDVSAPPPDPAALKFNVASNSQYLPVIGA